MKWELSLLCWRADDLTYITWQIFETLVISTLGISKQQGPSEKRYDRYDWNWYLHEKILSKYSTKFLGVKNVSWAYTGKPTASDNCCHQTIKIWNLSREKSWSNHGYPIGRDFCEKEVSHTCTLVFQMN